MNSLIPTRASTRMTGLAALMIAGAALLADARPSQAGEAQYVYDVYYGYNGQWVHWQSYVDPNEANGALQYLATYYPQLPRTWRQRYYASSNGPDISGGWTISPSANTAFGGGFTGTRSFQLGKAGVDLYMIPGGYYRSQIKFEGGNQFRFYTESGASGAVGRAEMSGGYVRRITWSDGSVWTR